MKKVLDINGLTKRYKNGRGVGDISFSVGEGEVIGLLGPNGSGKTTVMKSIIGFCRYDAGSIRVFGHDPSENKEAALAHVGCLIESPALYENLTAKRQLNMMARLYPDLPPTAVENALKSVGLERYANEKVRRFSLGMKQRLGIAMAFLSKPELVILDEPTNGLDIESSVELRKRIIKMAKQDKCSFLVSSHQADEIEKMCDRVVIIYEGALVDDVTVEEALRLSPSLEDYFLMRVRSEKGGAPL
ncbi:MAG: ABC transporter ATP-binding protein [Firmicutes bacterium]|nr:ABC transporter ATP-binding protein [Bacillota bacterium]